MSAAPSIVNALAMWAEGDDTRIGQITADRDACAVAILSGAKPTVTLTSGSQNGKTFQALANLTIEDKLALFHAVLVQLGEVEELPSGATANFSGIRR